MFYGDTAVFGEYAATVCGLDFFGVDHVLFASDAPFDPEKGPMYIRETIKIVDRLPISNEDRERIYWRNAAALLKLPAEQCLVVRSGRNSGGPVTNPATAETIRTT